MELSISSTAFHYRREDGKLVFDPEGGIRRCAEAGFRYLDMNFIAAGREGMPLAGDDWQSWIRRLGARAEENGLTVRQTHAYWWMNEMDPETWSRNEAVVLRSVEASAMLGKHPWMTAHTFSRYHENGYDAAATLQYNYELFCRLLEKAEAFGVRVAVENVFNIAGGIDYAAKAEELVELVERVNSPSFGICWDFGHANMAKADHLQALDIVAPYLRCVHVNDNKAKTDDHGVPFFGTVPWEKVMKKLKAVGYDGDLNMTVRGFTQTQNPQMQTEALRLLHTVGKELIRIFEEAEEA